MESFYVSPEDITDAHLSIKGDEFHHLSHVLRKKTGDEIRVVDGTGTAYECVLDRIDRHEARCSVHKVLKQFNEPNVLVTLMLPVLKSHARIEWIVEKGTELGVSRFIPVHTERTIPHRIRYDRLRKIAFAAMKQCKRSRLPVIEENRGLRDILEKVDVSFDKVFIGHEGAPVSDTMRSVYGQLLNQRVLILAGPEGGFTEDELQLCERHGGHIVSLGIRRYRAETAALIMAVYIIHD